VSSQANCPPSEGASASEAQGDGGEDVGLRDSKSSPQLRKHLRANEDLAVDGQRHELAGSDTSVHVIFIEGHLGRGHGVEVMLN
jgi:hypothetical protein